MSRTEPSFGDDLPDSLKDKPASDPDVIKFYQNKAVAALTHQRDTYEARLADATRPAEPRVEPKRPSNADWFQDPNAAVHKVAPTREEFTAMTNLTQQTAIQNARMMSSQKFKDWKRFGPEVEKIINALDPSQAADARNWETAYYAVVGANHDRLVEEEVTKVRTSMSAESSTALNLPPPKQEPLTGDQKTIISKFGLTEDKYRKTQQQVEGRLWPAIQK